MPSLEPSCPSLTDASASFVEELPLHWPDLRVFVHWGVTREFFGAAIAQFAPCGGGIVFAYLPGALGRRLNYCAGTSFLVTPVPAQVLPGESYATAVLRETARWIHDVRSFQSGLPSSPVFLHIYARVPDAAGCFCLWVLGVDGVAGKEPPLVAAAYHVRQGHEVMDVMQWHPTPAAC